MNNMRHILSSILIILSIISNVHAQNVFDTGNSTNDSGKDKVDEMKDHLDVIPDGFKQRIEAVEAIAETVRKNRNIVSSIKDLATGAECPLPVGIKGEEKGCYDLYVKDIIAETDGENWIEACALIPLKESDKELAFEGRALLEGEYGVDTHGELELLYDVEREIGPRASIVFLRGTKIGFGCEGITYVKAMVAFMLKDNIIYGVDSQGKSTGKLYMECAVEFENFDDFSVGLNIDQRFKIKGIDELTFDLKGLTLDQSLSRTPGVVKFPANYFVNGNATDADRNAWRGVAISRASVELGGFFGNVNEAGALNFALEDAIIDGYGFTGHAKAANLIKDNAIDPAEWGMSISDLSFGMFKGHLDGLGFGGKLNIPPLGKASMMEYEAEYEQSSKTFIFNANLLHKVDFPILCADLQLDPSSNVEIKVVDSHIRPSIHANGKISINLPVEGSSFDVPDISFQNMVIQSERPYVKVGHFGLNDKIKSPSFAGFQISLNDISSIDGKIGISLDADVKINPQFKGSTRFSLIGDDEKWKVKDFSLEKILIDYNSKPFSVHGSVEFRSGDEIYGRGFRGDVDLSLLNDKFKLKAVGVFGNKDSQRYFLTDAFLETSPASGIQVPPALVFFGIGGGIYYGMKQTPEPTSDGFGKTISGIGYIPEKSAGLGFMASTKFALNASPTLFNAEVGFEMQFNNDWGVDFVSFTGEGKFVSDFADLGGISDNLKSAVAEKIKNGSDNKSSDKFKDMSHQEIDRLLGEKPKIGGALSATIAMKFDIEHDVYTADMHSYLDFGILKGAGRSNEMGWASAYFSPQRWYTYIGTPSNPLGVELLKIAKTKSYFMVGDDIPNMPQPPRNVLDVLKRYESKIATQHDDIAGKGFAFGSEFDVNLNVEVMPFYAFLGVGLGADMVMKNYGLSAHCAGMPAPLGINGWYASAQAWAWAKADVGMYFKLFHKKKKFSILNAHTAALLSGQGPNPMYLYGSVGGNFRILGGLVKGRFEVPFSIGEKCDIKGASPFGDMEVIKQVTPSENATDVDVFIAPQLVLNMAVDEEMDVDDNGNTRKYKIQLDEFAVKQKGSTVPLNAKLVFDQEKRVCTIDIADPLESETDYEVVAQVSFMEKKSNGRWEVVKDDETKQNVIEQRKVTFKSGLRPDHIRGSDILCSYPADGQYNFFVNEYDYAYLATSKNYEYLFKPANSKGEGIPEGYKQVISVEAKQRGDVKKSDFSMVSGENCGGIKGAKTYIEVPINKLGMTKDIVYSLSLINEPIEVASEFDNIKSTETRQDVGGNNDITIATNEATSDLSLLETTQIWSTDFRTSKYGTFREKMDNMETTDTYASQILSRANCVNGYMKHTDEGSFDMIESGDRETDLVKVIPDYSDTYWYTDSVAPLFYENKDVRAVIGEITPPMNAVELYTTNKNTKLSKETLPDVSLYATTYNRSAYDIFVDMVSVQDSVTNELRLSPSKKTELVEKFLNLYNIPIMTYGNYPLFFEYIIPGKNTITTKYKVDVIMK